MFLVENPPIILLFLRNLLKYNLLASKPVSVNIKSC